MFGQNYIETLRGIDPQVIQDEAEGLFRQVTDEYGHIAYARGLPGTYAAKHCYAGKDAGKTLTDIAEKGLFKMHHLAVGQVAPEIEGEDVAGETFRLSNYRGKVVVLTFSGNWCGPCRAMYPHEREMVERLKGESFVLLSVNTDEDKATLWKSIESGEITWRCWWDGGTDGPISEQWSISTFPTIHVLDHNGVVRYRDVASEKLDEVINGLLKEIETAEGTRE